MDFLDTLDSNLSKKRSHRMRSWYLYEQFKSLEKNQVEAVEQLKERSYQDRILRQELSERRARRKLYDQIGITASEYLNGIINNNQIRHNRESKSLCTSSDDLFGYTEQENEVIIGETDVASNHSQEESLNDEYETGEDHATETTIDADARSEATMIEDFRTTETADVNVDSHFDEVKEQLENLEKLTELCDEGDGMSVSMCSDDFKHISKKDISVYTQDNGVLMMWSKLVAFAYQVIELNNGCCSGDYGSQLLTAVLACDVLRRGFNKMCDILQPYVCPIKFATDPSLDSYKYCHKSVRRKKSHNRNHIKNVQCKIHNKVKARPKFARKYHSEHWQHFPSTDWTRRKNCNCHTSEPLRRVEKRPFSFDFTSSKSSSSNWPDFSNGSSRNLCSTCGSKPIRPVYKLSQYIDNILKEYEGKYD